MSTKIPTKTEFNTLEEIMDRMGFCGCGDESPWQITLILLDRAETRKYTFYDPKDSPEQATSAWVQFGAHVLNSKGLLEHGSGIGYAWLTDDGKLLLRWLRDYGTDTNAWPNRLGYGSVPDDEWLANHVSTCPDAGN